MPCRTSSPAPRGARRSPSSHVPRGGHPGGGHHEGGGGPRGPDPRRQRPGAAVGAVRRQDRRQGRRGPLGRSDVRPRPGGQARGGDLTGGASSPAPAPSTPRATWDRSAVSRSRWSPRGTPAPTVFLVPDDNCADARSAAGRAQLVRVATLDDARSSARGAERRRAGRLVLPDRRSWVRARRRHGEPHTVRRVKHQDGGRIVASPRLELDCTGACPVAMRPPVGAPTLNRRTRLLAAWPAGAAASRRAPLDLTSTSTGSGSARSATATSSARSSSPDPAVPARGAGDRRGRRAVVVDRLPVPSGLPPGVLAPQTLARYRTVIISRLRSGSTAVPVVVGVVAGLAAQGDWRPVQQFRNSTVQRHGPRVRHRPELLRLRAARSTGSRWASVAVIVQLSSARCSRTTCSAASGSPAAPARARRQRAHSWPCWPGCSCCSRRLPTTSTATSWSTPPRRRLHRCHLHRPERGGGAEADPALHLDDLRGRVLRRTCSGATCSCPPIAVVLLVLSRPGRRGWPARRRAAVHGRAERQRAGGARPSSATSTPPGRPTG